jgi:acetoacetyl-CoA synthetase
MLHPITKQVIFLGRSDGVLNPSGVRFGSAEIYSVIEDLFSDEVADSLCVGQRRPQDVDENVMLFLLMRPGANLTPDLITRIQKAIREKRSPRHVPRYIFQTPAIPVCFSISIFH